MCRASGTRGRYSPSAGAAGLRVQQPRQWCSSWFVLLERQQLARQRLVEQRGPNFKKIKITSISPYAPFCGKTQRLGPTG
nr:MAG TPA: hypothetical protein [Caudoviricetes sp.]